MELLATPRVPVDLLGTQAERLAQLLRSEKPIFAGQAARSAESIRQAAQSFEALFYSMLIRQLRESSQELGEGLFIGDHADIFGGLFDYYLGQFLAQRQQLGIGRMIQQQYERWQKASSPPKDAPVTPQTPSQAVDSQPQV